MLARPLGFFFFPSSPFFFSLKQKQKQKQKQNTKDFLTKMLENYTATGMKAKESLFFNDILNSEWNLKMSWNTTPENFSLGFPVTKEIPNPKNTRQTKKPPKTLPYLHQSKYLLYTKRSAPSKDDEVRGEKLYQPQLSMEFFIQWWKSSWWMKQLSRHPHNYLTILKTRSSRFTTLTFRKQHC